jgi:hypothetical protein
MEIKIDLSGALAKTATLARTPQAARKCLQRWGSETVLVLRRSAAGMKSSGRKSGQLARAVGMRMMGNVLTVGTNVQKKTDVKYAKIQDEGGTIKALNKFFSIANLPGRPRLGPFLTIPLGNTKGRVADYKNTFNIRSKSGNFLVMQSSRATGSMTTKRVYDPLTGRRTRGAPKATMKPLFVLKSRVTLPPTDWFSRPMFEQLPILNQYMDPDFIYDVAQNMAGTMGENA